MQKKSVAIKAAKIGMIGTIVAALITAIVALISNSDKQVPPSPNISIDNMSGDIVQGNKIVNQHIDSINVIPLPDLSDGKIKLEDISEYGGLNLDGYNLYQSLKLNKFSNGIHGALLILLDKRVKGITGELKYDGYKNTITPHFQSDFGESDMNFDQLKQALLVVVDERLKILYYEYLGRESARIDRVFIYPNKNIPTYILTRDYSVGAGSYAGPVSYFLEVNASGITYILDKESFTVTLKSGWLIKQSGVKSEILYKRCRPGQIDPNTGDLEFLIHYDKYLLVNNIWQSRHYQKKGFWEYFGDETIDLDDFNKQFPD